MTTTGETSPDDTQKRRPRLAERLLPDRLLGETPILDEFTDQLDRTRRLLTGSPEEAAELALDRFGGEIEVEARIAIELAVLEPLAHPGRFLEAHRIVMRALEVLDREGSRNPAVPNLGPLTAIAKAGVGFVAEYVVKSYAEGIVGSLRRLYARREVQAAPQSPERKLLAGARIEVDRIAPGFSGGGVGAPVLIAGGLALPLLASLSQYVGAINFTNRWLLMAFTAVLFLLFLSLSTILLRGAAVARHRSRLIMRQPLAALWETVGHAGDPPEDDSVLIATGAVILAALVWFVLPVGGAIIYLVF